MKTASYVSSASDDAKSLTLFNTWVPLSPLTITVPALDLPVATKALVMFQARCSANVAMAITFHLLVDGSVVQYTDAWPTANQMLIFPMSDVITLSANTSHTISIKWRTGLVEGTASNALIDDCKSSYWVSRYPFRFSVDTDGGYRGGNMSHPLVQRIVLVIREYRAEQRSRRPVGPP